MTAEHDHAQTMVYAEIALGQIKALQQPPLPRNYEIWYHYAARHNPQLNSAINERLDANGNLTQAEVDHIYDVYLSPLRHTQRIDTVGARVMDEIGQVVAMIDSAAGNASKHTENLAGVAGQLGSVKDSDGLRTIVASLIHSTKEMEFANRHLEDRLKYSKHEINQLQENLAAVRNESLTDPLTGLANRKSFDEGLTKAVADANRDGHPVSLIMADIDHFKKFNDNYGHLTGDQVLRLVATSLQQNIKDHALAARYGGEEFAIVLPNTALQRAKALADQIRRAVATKELIKRSTGENLGRVTVSLGVASWQHGESMQNLIERADTCLYAAKRGGRNRMICETDPELSPLADARVA
ncbi:MAG: GGDEF domain-containing protein [Proteobacteria bacterium]|nr:GGDEF domain-containing protein [Pseudomonadota bacterium]